MKKNIRTPSQEGIQPIRVLQHNITYNFENTNPGFLKLSQELVAKNGLNPGIDYCIIEEPIKTPFVNENKIISIHETFLSYLWINCYSLMVLYDEAVVKPMQNSQLHCNKNIINTDFIKLTEELFQYGKSLIRIYTQWDKNKYPNPEEYSDEEEFYIKKANGIFVYATNFILCHELAHVEKRTILMQLLQA